MRARLLLMTVVALAAAASFVPAGSGGLYVPVTSAEKKQTRPLVDVMLAVQTSGQTWRVCDVLSYHLLRQQFRTRAECRTKARRHPARPCGTCTYRISKVLGLYATVAARRQGRKTVGWLIVVKGDPSYRGESELELRFIREDGGWALDYWLSGGDRR